MTENSMNIYGNMSTAIRYMDAVNGDWLLVVWSPLFIPSLGESVTIVNRKMGWDKKGNVFSRSCSYYTHHNVCEIEIGLIDVVDLE